MTGSTPAPPDRASVHAPSPARKRASLAATCTAAGLVWFAFSSLGVALPSISRDISADLSTLQWANNAFSLTTGALVVATGRFGDIVGQRRILRLGLIVFGACSAIAAIAPNAALLITGRALMGVGAAMILPATLALIPAQFSGKARLTAFGVWQAVAWGGQGIGPALSGIITDGPGWRWLFWINVPLAVATLLAIRAFTPEKKDASARPMIDWIGLVCIAGAVFALMYALTEGPAKGWDSPLVLVPFIGSVLLAALWLRIESHTESPLVDLSLFKLRSYDGALVANLAINLAFGGMSYLLALWLQSARGYSAMQAGLLLLPSTVGIFALIPLGSRRESRKGARNPIALGLMLLVVGFAALGLLSDGSTMILLGGALLVIGAGLGLLSTPVSDTAVGEVPQELNGTAAGLFKMSSMVGGALGVAILSAVAIGFASNDAIKDAKAAGFSEPEIAEASHSLVGSSTFQSAVADLPDTIAKKTEIILESSFTAGVARAMIATALIVAISIVILLRLWRPGETAKPTSTKPTTTTTTTTDDQTTQKATGESDD